MNMKKLVMLALAALVAIPVFAQDDDNNRIYTASSGKAFIDLFSHMGYGYNFVDSKDYTPGWSGEFVFNLVKFGLRPADVLGIDLGIDFAWNTFDSKTNAFKQENQLIKVTDFSHYVEGSVEKKNSGFDVIGLDPIADGNLTRHKKLFAACDIVNIENLKNLELCGNELFWFSCFPLRLDNCDGSPVRAVAWFE